MRVRSASFAAPPAPTDPAFEHIHEPGGFRRNYVLLRANEQGTEEPRMSNNFIDFLFIFGHFVRLSLVSVVTVLKIELRRARTLRKTMKMTRLKTRRLSQDLHQGYSGTLLQNRLNVNHCSGLPTCQDQGHVPGVDVCPSVRTGMLLLHKQC